MPQVNQRRVSEAGEHGHELVNNSGAGAGSVALKLKHAKSEVAVL